MTTFYSDTLRDESARPIPGATVYVYDASGALTGSLTDELGTPISNPLTTDEFGNYSFEAVDGFYTLDVFFGGRRVYKQNLILGVIPLDGAKGLLASNRSAMAAITGQSAGQTALLGESGREGLFVWTTGNLAAFVTADTTQGIYVAPASAPTGASGAWVRRYSGPADARWFGAKADDTTNDNAAIVAALALLRVLRESTHFGYGIGGSIPLYCPGHYYMGGAKITIDWSAHIMGDGQGRPGAACTQLRFDDGVGGFLFTYSGSSGWVFEGATIVGGFNPASSNEGEFHGLEWKTVGTVRNVSIYNFGGDGLYQNNNVAANGNSNGTIIDNVFVSGCRRASVNISSDVNGCYITGLEAVGNRQCGIWEADGLGNTYEGFLLEANGFAAGWNGQNVNRPCVNVHNSGFVFTPIVGQETGASTNSPPTTATNNTWWLYVRTGLPGDGQPQWVSGLKVRAGGGIIHQGLSSRSQFSGYIEADEASQFDQQAIILNTQGSDNQKMFLVSGGALVTGGPNAHRPPMIEAAGGRLQVPGAMNVLGRFRAKADNFQFGPDSGTSDVEFQLLNTSLVSQISFWQSGVQKGWLGTINGTMYVNGLTGVNLRFNGTDNVTVSATGLDMLAGKLLLTAASASGGAGFRLPHGAAPSSPTDGDVWTTTGGIFSRVNGASKTVAFLDSAITPTTLNVGTGTTLTKVVVYTPSITPASVGAATVAEQTFAVTGLTTADKVIVNPPAIANATGIAGARVSAADTLAIRFVNPTAGALTPTSGTYTVMAFRS